MAHGAALDDVEVHELCWMHRKEEYKTQNTTRINSQYYTAVTKTRTGLEQFFTFQHIINMAHDFDIQYAYNMILLVLLVLFQTLFQALLMHAVDMMIDDKYIIGFHGMLC